MKRLLTMAFATLAATGAMAQAYPAKPVTFIVPFAAGGPTDKVARDLADTMRKSFGQQIIVENVAGAGGTLGHTRVAKANNDGYTVLLAHIAMATAPALYRNLQYKTFEDFEFAGLINEVPMTLIGRPTLQANNFAELRQWINANKDKVNLAHAGLGSASHLCGLLFQQKLGVEMTTVPYKGTAPAMTDLIGGQVDLLCDQTTNTTPQIEGGKVKAYAVTTAKRLNTPATKNLPTLAEAGVKDFNVTIWHGLYAPKGTPKPVIEKLNTSLKAALKDPEFIKRQEALGAIVVNDNRVNPAEHRKFVEAETNKWGPIIKAAGQYAD